MVENIGIARIPTAEEQGDYKTLGGTSPKERFLRELSKIGQEFVKKHLPFDEQCAKMDFDDRLERVEKESQRRHGFVRQSDLNIDLGDLKKYGDIKRFELLEDDEVLEFQNINNTKTAVVTGHNMKYKCTERNHGCTVVVPLELWQEKFGKKTKIVEKE